MTHRYEGIKKSMLDYKLYRGTSRDKIHLNPEDPARSFKVSVGGQGWLLV